MKRNYLLKLSIFILALVATVNLLTVHAQTPTASTLPTIITQTPSITVTVTPTVTTTEEAPTPTPTIAERSDSIQAVVTIGTQSPWNKRIPVKVAITPNISGEKLSIRWQQKAGLVAEPTLTTIMSPQAGKTYTVSFTITPYSIGYQRAVADIILTTKSTNLVISKDVSLQLNENKVVIPTTPMYVFYQVIMYLFIVLVFFVLIPFGLYKGYLYIKLHVFPKWLESKIQSPK